VGGGVGGGSGGVDLLWVGGVSLKGPRLPTHQGTAKRRGQNRKSKGGKKAGGQSLRGIHSKNSNIGLSLAELGRGTDPAASVCGGGVVYIKTGGVNGQ